MLFYNLIQFWYTIVIHIGYQYQIFDTDKLRRFEII